MQREAVQYDTITKTKKEPHGTGGKRNEEKGKTAPFAVEEITVKGDLSKKIIGDIIERNRKAFEACPCNVTLPRKFVITLIINPDGSVKDIRTVSGTSQNTIVAKCFIDIMRQLSFLSHSPIVLLCTKHRYSNLRIAASDNAIGRLSLHVFPD